MRRSLRTRGRATVRFKKQDGGFTTLIFKSVSDYALEIENYELEIKIQPEQNELKTD